MEIYVLTMKREGSDLVNVGAFSTFEKAVSFALEYVFEMAKPYGHELDQASRSRIEATFRGEMKRLGSSVVHKRVYSIVKTNVV